MVKPTSFYSWLATKDTLNIIQVVTIDLLKSLSLFNLQFSLHILIPVMNSFNYEIMCSVFYKIKFVENQIYNYIEFFHLMLLEKFAGLNIHSVESVMLG